MGEPHCGSGVRGHALALLLLLLVGGCDGVGAGPSRALVELERLAFVPASRSFLSDDLFSSLLLQRFSDVSLERALLVDRFEVTRRDCEGLGVELVGQRDVAEDDSASRFVTDGAKHSEESLDWPAYLTFDQASQVAARRNMRLPTPTEWLHVATGGRRLQYPYHLHTSQKGFANTLDLGLGRPAAVGSFENGKSQGFGCYDLHGNVWEWVDGAVPGHDDSPGLAEAVTDPGGAANDELASVMGGSYQSRSRRTFEITYGEPPITFHARLLDRRSVQPDVGARLVADADDYLLAHGGLWGDDEESRARVRAVGRAWSDAVGRGRVSSYLEGLLQRDGAPSGIKLLLEGAQGERVR